MSYLVHRLKLLHPQNAYNFVYTGTFHAFQRQNFRCSGIHGLVFVQQSAIISVIIALERFSMIRSVAFDLAVHRSTYGIKQVNINYL